MFVFEKVFEFFLNWNKFVEINFQINRLIKVINKLLNENLDQKPSIFQNINHMFI